MSDSLWPHGLHHTRPPCPSPTPRVYTNSCPFSQWCHPIISSSPSTFNRPLLLPPSIFLSIRVFSNESVLLFRGPKYFGVSASASVLPMNTQDFRIDLLDLLAVQRDSQESSLTPQFKSIKSSVLSFLYSPTLTSIHDRWKNHNLD